MFTFRLLCLLLLLFCSNTAFALWSLPSIPFLHPASKESEAKKNSIELDYKITGLPEDLADNVLAWLAADQKNMSGALTLTDINRSFQQAPASIVQAVQPFGYFKARVTTNHLQKMGPRRWLATYHVEKGPALLVTHMQVKITGAGAQQTAFQNYLTNLPLKQGQVLQTKQYEDIKKTLNNIATQNGFLAARFTQNIIKIDLTRYTSDIVLIFDTGPQYYFGKVIFKQNKLDDGFLQRYVRFKPDTPYSPDALLKLQQDLSSSPYFKSVDIEPEERADQLYVPVNVNLQPASSQHYNFGVGYGTDTGIRGTIGWTVPRVTSSGQNFNANIQASEIQNSLEARYIIPGNNPITQQYFIGANVMQESPNTSEGHTQKLSFGKTNNWHGWKSTLSLSEQFDHYSLRGDPFQYSHLLLPSIGINKIGADDPVFPRFGYSIGVNLLGSAQPLLSSTSFFQTELVGKYIFSPTKYSRVIARGDLGLTSVGNIDNVPLSLQFFAGGSDSIRGYSYDELGPGRYLVTGSLEFQHQIIPKWYGAVFVDTGNAVNSFANPQNNLVGPKQPNIVLSDILKTSVGIGPVWVSPVGPMELTVAKPVTDPGKSVRIQFTMGTGL